MNIKKANILLSFVIFVFVSAAFRFRIDNPWYGSSVCFPLGIIYAQKEEAWNEFLESNYLIKNIVLILFCGINILLFFILGNDSIIGNPIARNFAAGAFCLWVVSVIRKIKLDYKLFRWLGEISYEIFLIHPVWINVFEVISNKLIYLLLVIGVTIISAWIIHIPLSKITKRIRRCLV